VKVRLNSRKSTGAIARLEAILAGMILTVSTAYAATVCPMYWTQLQLEADLRNRLAIAEAVDCWHRENGDWPHSDLRELAKASVLASDMLVSPLHGRPYRLDPQNHRIQ
jgi:hypothetical protein